MKLAMRHRLVPLIFLVVSLFLAGPTFADSTALEVRHAGQGAISAKSSLELFDDEDGRLTLDDVLTPAHSSRFKPYDGDTTNIWIKVSPATHWLRLRLKNSGDQTAEQLLEIPVARFAATTNFYKQVDDNRYESIETGYLRPFSARPYKNHYYVFPITVPANSERTVYFQLQSPVPISAPAMLWHKDDFHQSERLDYSIQSLYFGMVLAMVAYNFLLFIAIRDSNYLLYVLFVISTAFTIASNNGLAMEYLFGEMPALVISSTMVGSSILLITLILFMRRMIGTPHLVPRLDKSLLALIPIHLILPIALAISFSRTLTTALIIDGATIAFTFFVAGYCALRRSRSAIFFIAAFAVLAVAGFQTALRGLGWVEPSFLTVHGLQFGSALEMIVLAIALADRFNEARKERAKAQQEALIAENKALLAQNATELAQKETQLAQTQLMQADKMAALGQLIAGVTHEINTPIGAVKSSGHNITEALDHALSNMPRLFKSLDNQSSDLFLRLIDHAHEPAKVLNSREERAITRDAARQLEEAGIDNAQIKASLLVQLNAHGALLDYLPLLRHAECDLILETARNVTGIIQSAHNINVAVDRAVKIVHALKSFSHFNQAGELIEANLVDGIETVLTIYQGQIKRGTELIREYEDIPPINCLPDELNQVWTNLIHNALQAMNFEGTLTIGIRREGKDAVVSVGDSGCGIPDDIRGKIFDVFFTTKPAGVGSGLGLDIVKKIIDKHKGRIDLKSEVGVGTTFLIYLPYDETESRSHAT